MSKYRESLHDIYEFGNGSCFLTVGYRGEYIHSSVYNGVTIFRVYLNGKSFYSKSLVMCQKFIKENLV